MHLLPAVLVAVQARGSEIANVVLAAVHLRLFVFDGWSRRAIFCKGAPAIATAAMLSIHQTGQNAPLIFSTHAECTSRVSPILLEALEMPG
jgi:hypothetical protein